ncbi:MAG: S8 family serine peptidase, partial [Candidatus Marinimicrobia bacterium]|nr:S8 family serine peptidase [Candidatus Neomarinimicrobiota bacterium]
MSKCSRKLTLLLLIVVFMSTSLLMAGMKTTTFQGKEVVSNSIVVVDKAMQNFGTPTKASAVLSALEKVKSTYNVRIGKRVAPKGAEEWQISGDMEKALNELNAIPGISAFPNYVFHRPEVTQRSMDKTSKPTVPDWRVQKTMGPTGESGQYAVVDDYNQLWITDYGTPGTSQIFVFNADGSQAWFSPITSALDDTGAVLSLAGQQMGGVAYSNGVVYAISYVAKKIVRFNSYDGSPLNAIPISFSAGDLDIDQYGHIFVAYKTAAMFAVFDANGVQMKGSPFGVTGWSVNRGISVTADGSKILLPNESKNLIYEWNGVYPASDSVSFERDTTDFVKNLNKPSACEIDAYGTVWISNTGANEIVMTDMNGNIYKRIPNLTAVRGVAFDYTNNYTYAIHFTSAVPMVTQLEPLVDDPYFGYQYALNNDGSFSSTAVPGADMDILRAWNVSTGGKMLVNSKKENVIVAVFDDGVDFDHADLKNNAWINPGEDLNGDGVVQDEEINGYDDDGNGFVDDFWGWSPVYDQNIYLNPGSFHGTHVAGIIGAEGMNGIGISGVNQHVKLISVMIFDESGSTDAISIMYGYYYVSTLLKEGVNIVAMNQSWGGGSYFMDRGEAKFVECMTNYALDHNQHNMLWVCSSGNTGTDGDEMNYYRYPSGIQAPNIIAVGATDASDNMASYSTYGKVTTDVGAPGDEIASTYPGNSYVFMSGTSMAAPHVTGLLALSKSVFPNDDAYALIARVLGTAEPSANFNDLWMTEDRVNAFYAVSPESLSTGLIPSIEQAYVTRSMYDDAGMVTLGFVNATGADITVSGADITGTNAADFSFYNTFTTKTVKKGEAFGLPVAYMPVSKGASIATLTINTSAGNVVIPINGEEKTYAEISIDPFMNPVQLVQWGDTVTTSFNVSSVGDKSLEYSLYQYLESINADEVNPQLTNLIKYKPASAAQTKPDVNQRTLVEEQFGLIAPVVAGLERKHYSINSASKGESILWSDSLNDAAVVAENWYTLAFGSGDAVNETFNLYDVNPTDTVNNVFLAGDFVNGYKDNTIAVAVSPMFDFLPVGDQTGMMPSYLQFDYAAQLENGYDYFYVNVIVDGERYQTIVQTDYNLTADSLMHSVYVDISHLWGMRNVEFWFIFYTDGSTAGGFGSLFDNVAITQTDAPYWASSYDGVLEPGQTETITSTLRSDMLYPGKFYLISEFESNAIVQDYYNSLNIAPFNIVIGHLTLNPKRQDIGSYYRDETTYSNFTATNDGIVDVEFYADYIINRKDDGDDSIQKTVVKTIEAAKASVDSKEKTTVSKTEPKSLEARLDVIKGMLTQKPTKAVSTKKSLDEVSSGFFRGFRGDYGETIYTENFDSSNVLPEGWLVEDWTYGLGDVWHLENFGSDTLVDNLMFFGNSDVWEYYPGSNTIAYSPVFDLTGLTDDTTRLIFEFDYAAYLEPGYDYFYMYVGYVYQDTSGVEYIDWRYIGDTDEVFENDGEMHSMMLNLPRAKGHKMLIAFCASSDYSVNEGFAAFDNLKVYTL